MNSRWNSMASAHELAESWPQDVRLGGLIARTVRGDEAAFAALYDATVAVVHGLALRIVGDVGAAEEVTADVYLQVWRQAVRYDATRATPLGWLLMLARSRAIDRVRARAAQRREVGSLQEALQLASAAPGPHEDAIIAERRRIVVAALDALPSEQRAAIELAYYGGKSHREIAAALNLPLGTVKTRIRIGMSRLRDALAPALEESR